MKAPHEMRPGNRYAREIEARKTLADLISRKAALVAICRHCKHRRLLFPPSLATHLGEDFRVAELGKRLRCQNCGRAGAANVHESTR
jgi:DNA-directed RNA polymerase subunit RPC12/RpoP